ncbi:hypothetical protein VQ045_18905 [Aurantimonas sp. E1-2-R+4]|uniref:hypothetical protein n=1 Tax=Aurantimonas sp. E1-2-R+4 TaxID=3113714 RepID=UPI002F953F4D
MPTNRETILAAQRGDVLPERVPAAGLLILRDGEPGEPEVTLSPLRDHYQHRASARRGGAAAPADHGAIKAAGYDAS